MWVFTSYIRLRVNLVLNKTKCGQYIYKNDSRIAVNTKRYDGNRDYTRKYGAIHFDHM